MKFFEIKEKLMGVQNFQLIVRLAVFAALSFAVYSHQPGHSIPFFIPFAALGLHLALSVGLLTLTRFSWTGFALAGLDIALGGLFLFWYPQNLFFPVPIFLATFSAGAVSAKGALVSFFLGTLLCFLGETYLHADSLFWEVVAPVNFMMVGIGFVTEAALKQKSKMDSLVDLIEAGQYMGSALTYEKLFEFVFSVVKNLFNAETCAIYVKDSHDFMILRDVKSPYAKLFHDFDPAEVKSEVQEIVSNKVPKLFPDIYGSYPPQEQLLPSVKSIRSAMIAPLVIKDDAIGLIFAASPATGVYTPESLKLFTVLANQISISMQNAQLFEKTVTLATTDSISGLFTHAYMQEILEKEFHKSKLNNYSLSIIILDVDHFKVVNDQYGHPQGDLLLRQFASLLRTVARSADKACRYGGDEFLLVLPETDRTGAVILAERLRQSVEEYEFVLGSKIIHITASLGVASLKREMTGKELIQMADQALYQAKNGGRNKVCFVS